MERWTVKELVDKYKSMESKLEDIKQALRKMQGNEYHATELMERAAKDSRYAVILLVQEHRRIESSLDELGKMQVGKPYA